METSILSEIIKKYDEFIMATGGGTPHFNNNISLINKSGISIFIDTDREILILKENANVTPKSAECDKVSPKYARRRQMTKHPNGPVTIATPIPATKALTKKSSNIIFLFFHQYHENDHDDAYIKRG